MPEQLDAIPGIGEKTAAALSKLEDPLAALTDGDVLTISSAPGISPRRAARLVRNTRRYRYDDETPLLKTERAEEIRSELIELFQGYTVTDYGYWWFETLYPATAPARIDTVRDRSRRALKRSPGDAVRDSLAEVAPLTTPEQVTVRDRCLVAADADTYAAAEATYPELSVETVNSRRELAELAQGYTTVIVLEDGLAGLDLEGDIRVWPDALNRPTEVVPERTLAWFGANKQSITAAITAAQAAGLDVPEETVALETALEEVQADGTVKPDQEHERISTALEELDQAVTTAESVANDQLRTALEHRDVTVEGSDLLSLVEQGASVDSLLVRELDTEYTSAVTHARDELVATLSLTDTEARHADQLFPTEPTFPVEHNEAALTRLRKELRQKHSRRSLTRKRDQAVELAAYRDLATDVVEEALALDVDQAIARFAAAYDATLPTFLDKWQIEITGGRSPLLGEPPEAIEPVDYTVDGVVLLSGVNSGGKTSTLELLAAVVTLAQMGLPVPAETARLGRFQELHVHGRTQGTLDAGAFESTLAEFADLAAGRPGALVLVDELESITEPGASAKIIAGILERLHRSDATAVFVSHLAREIQAAATVDIQVDGIEARGIEEGALRVDRSPKRDHLARSTPELIVEKLADETGEEFYRALLEKFD